MPTHNHSFVKKDNIFIVYYYWCPCLHAVIWGLLKIKLPYLTRTVNRNTNSDEWLEQYLVEFFDFVFTFFLFLLNAICFHYWSLSTVENNECLMRKRGSNSYIRNKQTTTKMHHNCKIGSTINRCYLLEITTWFMRLIKHYISLNSI